MEYEKTGKTKRYFYTTMKSSLNFLQSLTIVYFVFMPDWPDNLNKLLFCFAVMGTANLLDIACFFPQSCNI